MTQRLLLFGPVLAVHLAAAFALSSGVPTPAIPCWLRPDASASAVGALDPACPLRAHERIERVRSTHGWQRVYTRGELAAALRGAGARVEIISVRGAVQRTHTVPLSTPTRALRVARFAGAVGVSAALMALAIALLARVPRVARRPVASVFSALGCIAACAVHRGASLPLDVAFAGAQSLLPASAVHLALVFPRERQVLERAPGLPGALYAAAAGLATLQGLALLRGGALGALADGIAGTLSWAAVGGLALACGLAGSESESARERAIARVLLVGCALVGATLAALALGVGVALSPLPQGTVIAAIVLALGIATWSVSVFALLDVPFAVRWMASALVTTAVVTVAIQALGFALHVLTGTPPVPGATPLFCGVFAATVVVDGVRRAAWRVSGTWITPWTPRLERRRGRALRELSVAGSADAVIRTLVDQVRAGLGAEGVAGYLALGTGGWRLAGGQGCVPLRVGIEDCAARALRARSARATGVGAVVVHLDHHEIDAEATTALDAEGIDLVVLLQDAGEGTGLLLARTAKRAGSFSSDHLDFLEQVCTHAALALANVGLQHGLVTAARMAALGHAAAGLAHDLGRPLGEILVEASDERRDADTARSALASVRALADECLDHLERFVADCKSDPGEATRAVPLDVVLCAALDRMRKLHPDARIVARQTPSLPPVPSPRDVQRVIENLLENALEWGPPGEAVEIYARTDREDAVVQVTDRGPGLGSEARRRAFEPFFSQRRPGRPRRGAGAGLGLTIVRHVVQALGGSVAASAPPGGPTRFTVRLPVAAP